METTLNIWQRSRELFLEFIDNYSLEQLNTIPQGFSNNLIWNIGHIVVAQQGLVYKLSGHSGYLSDELSKRYMPGSQPNANTTQAEVDELRALLLDLVHKTKQDLKSGIFQSFTPRRVGIGYELKNLTDALEFVNYHEGLHLGMMMQIRKFI